MSGMHIISRPVKLVVIVVVDLGRSLFFAPDFDWRGIAEIRKLRHSNDQSKSVWVPCALQEEELVSSFMTEYAEAMTAPSLCSFPSQHFCTNLLPTTRVLQSDT